MQTTAIPPGPSEGFDLGGSEESLVRLQDYFARFGPEQGLIQLVQDYPNPLNS